MKQLLILSMIMLGGISLGQSNKKGVDSSNKPISFVGKVANVETQIKSSTDAPQNIYVHLDMKIINNSGHELIFPTKDFGCKTISLKRPSGKFIANLQLPTEAELPEWKKIVKAFDKDMPPASKATVLNVGDELNFNTFFRLDVSNNENDFLSSQSISSEDLKKKSLIIMEVNCTTKPKGLDVNNIKVNEDSFWKNLRTRWSKYGYLWLDDIVSEPIPLDLSSTIIKTESHP